MKPTVKSNPLTVSVVTVVSQWLLLQCCQTIAKGVVLFVVLHHQAIDVIDEAGSRVRIAAYNSRRHQNKREDPKIREYLQVLETKDDAIKDGLFEEASILRRREMDYKTELAGNSNEGTSLPVVDVADVEAVVAAWTGIPVERMTEDDITKLMRLVGGCCLLADQQSTHPMLCIASAQAACLCCQPARNGQPKVCEATAILCA